MSEPNIIVGVTGGIAAYKTAALVSRMVQDGLNIQVVMTESAQQFVGAQTFAALSGQSVAGELFDPCYPLGAHIELARSCQLLCIAPASASFLSKAANGLSNDLLSALYLCCTCPVVMAPAMNCEMWDQPATQRNLQQLKSDGIYLVGPEQGWLSCRVQGWGRMSEPEKIREAIDQLL